MASRTRDHLGGRASVANVGGVAAQERLAVRGRAAQVPAEVLLDIGASVRRRSRTQLGVGGGCDRGSQLGKERALEHLSRSERPDVDEQRCRWLRARGDLRGDRIGFDLSRTLRVADLDLALWCLLASRTLLRHVGQLVRHQAQIAARLAATEEHVTAMRERSCAEGRRRFMGQWVAMDPDAGKVSAEPCADTGRDGWIHGLSGALVFDRCRRRVVDRHVTWLVRRQRARQYRVCCRHLRWLASGVVRRLTSVQAHLCAHRICASGRGVVGVRRGAAHVAAPERALDPVAGFQGTRAAHDALRGGMHRRVMLTGLAENTCRVARNGGRGLQLLGQRPLSGTWNLGRRAGARRLVDEATPSWLSLDPAAHRAAPLFRDLEGPM